MNKKIVCSALVAAFAFAGCSIKAPEPKNAFKGEQMTINNRLLDRQYHFVPKDSYWVTNWHNYLQLSKNKSFWHGFNPSTRSKSK